jgi:hypothetical protein
VAGVVERNSKAFRQKAKLSAPCIKVIIIQYIILTGTSKMGREHHSGLPPRTLTADARSKTYGFRMNSNLGCRDGGTDRSGQGVTRNTRRKNRSIDGTILLRCSVCRPAERHHALPKPLRGATKTELWSVGRFADTSHLLWLRGSRLANLKR